MKVFNTQNIYVLSFINSNNVKTTKPQSKKETKTETKTKTKQDKQKTVKRKLRQTDKKCPMPVILIRQNFNNTSLQSFS